MDTFSIRRAQPADAQIIAHCNRAMAQETEGRDLAEAVILSGVQRLMANPEYGFYIIAESTTESVPKAGSSTTVAGTLMVTTEWSDWRDGLFWWIQSVYVSPECRRQGVYRQMYSFIKNDAAQHPDVCGFRLYVEKDNHIAQRTYDQLGMQPTDYLMYEEIR